MTDLFILCHNKRLENDSSAALERALLARGIDTYRVTKATPNRKAEEVRFVLDHGVSTAPEWTRRLSRDVKWLNTPDTVRISANKLNTFRFLYSKGLPTVDWTTAREVAEAWLLAGERVVSRTVLDGCAGGGIVLSPPDPMPEAPLYTRLFTGPNVREYRVFVVGGVAVDLLQKKRWTRERREAAGINHHDPYQGLLRCGNSSGWVFARNDIIASVGAINGIKLLALDCAEACNLTYGAVDIIASHTNDGELIDMRIVEPNTAPSLIVDNYTVGIVASGVANYLRRLG